MSSRDYWGKKRSWQRERPRRLLACVAGVEEEGEGKKQAREEGERDGSGSLLPSQNSLGPLSAAFPDLVWPATQAKGCLPREQDGVFSNSLIIHQAKTKKITTVKEVLIPGLN